MAGGTAAAGGGAPAATPTPTPDAGGTPAATGGTPSAAAGTTRAAPGTIATPQRATAASPAITAVPSAAAALSPARLQRRAVVARRGLLVSGRAAAPMTIRVTISAVAARALHLHSRTIGTARIGHAGAFKVRNPTRPRRPETQAPRDCHRRYAILGGGRELT